MSLAINTKLTWNPKLAPFVEVFRSPFRCPGHGNFSTFASPPRTVPAMISREPGCSRILCRACALPDSGIAGRRKAKVQEQKQALHAKVCSQSGLARGPCYR